jgi:hypothetical protein
LTSVIGRNPAGTANNRLERISVDVKSGRGSRSKAVGGWQ